MRGTQSGVLVLLNYIQLKVKRAKCYLATAYFSFHIFWSSYSSSTIVNKAFFSCNAALSLFIALCGFCATRKLISKIL